MNTAPSPCTRGFDARRGALQSGALQSGARLSGARQCGLTLVELMVSLAIGLFLVLVATTIYMQGLSAFNFRQGQSENQGNSRYAKDALEAALSRAGYRRSPLQAPSDAFPADTQPHANGCQFAQGQALYAVDKQTLCLRFQARDAAETDCAGTASGLGKLGPYEAPAAGTGLLVERYALADGALTCQAGTPAQSVPLADGVRAWYLEFGIDTQTDPQAVRQVEQFSADLPAATSSIRALRYALLLQSSGRQLTQGMSSTVCARWTALGGASASCGTERLHQLAIGTLSLRNLMP